MRCFFVAIASFLFIFVFLLAHEISVFAHETPSVLPASCAKIVATFSSESKTLEAKKKVDLLWRSFFETHSVEARNALVEFYMPLVHHFVRPIARRIEYGLEPEDLESVGSVGLIRAIERYDPAMSVAFEHFAGYRIQGEVLDFARRTDFLSRTDRARLKRLRAAQQNFFKAHGRPASEDELRSALSEAGFSADEVLKTIETQSRASTFSLFAESQDQEFSEMLDSQSALQDSHSDEGVKSVDQKEFWDTFFRRSGFSERTALVLRRFFYERKTQKEISEELEMSDANISLILSRAIRILQSLAPEKQDELKSLLSQ
jgi:RNA polymerase sigma factor for flagellar operon FliA